MFVLRALVMLLHAEPDFRSASARKKAKQGVAEGRQSRRKRGREAESEGSCCSKGSGDGSGCVFICVPANLKLVLLLVSVSRKLVEADRGEVR